MKHLIVPSCQSALADFTIDAINIHTHAIRRSIISCTKPQIPDDYFALLTTALATVWISIHLPFIMGYVIASASLSKIVLAHDCSDTDVHSLGGIYEARSEEEIPIGMRWFYCAGLGVALLCMSKSRLPWFWPCVAVPVLIK